MPSHSTKKLRDCLRSLTQELSQAATGLWRLEVELLASAALGLSRLELCLAEDKELSSQEEEKLKELVARRKQGEPIAYIIGRKEFYGREFIVSPATLIPRPDTETLIDSILQEDEARSIQSFADLGTGTGCIGLSLCLERPQWQGFLLEYSEPALKIARQNKKELKVNNASLLQGDIFSLPFAEQSFDLIVSNPPYIAEEERSTIMRDVIDFEPEQALFSTNSGLSHLASIAHAATRLLRPSGRIVLEHGYQQAEAVQEILRKQNFSQIHTKKDLSGLDRMTRAVYICPRCC